MPVQSYNINTRDAVAGQVYGSSHNQMIHSLRLESDSGLDFGLPVLKSGDRDAKDIPTANSDSAIVADFFVGGLAIRQVNREQASRPGTGEIKLASGEIIGVLLEGFMQVEFQDVVVAGGDVYVDVTTGLLYGADGANRHKALNLRCEQGAGAGEIGVVQVANNAIHA